MDVMSNEDVLLRCTFLIGRSVNSSLSGTYLGLAQYPRRRWVTLHHPSAARITYTTKLCLPSYGRPSAALLYCRSLQVKQTQWRSRAPYRQRWTASSKSSAPGAGASCTRLVPCRADKPADTMKSDKRARTTCGKRSRRRIEVSSNSPHSNAPPPQHPPTDSAQSSRLPSSPTSMAKFTAKYRVSSLAAATPMNASAVYTRSTP